MNTEWPVLSTIDKNVRFSFGARNDDRNLYIALITSDSATGLQALNEGLIVWFDVEGGTKKRFGIHYPVSRMGGRGGARGGGEGWGRGEGRRPGEGGEHAVIRASLAGRPGTARRRIPRRCGSAPSPTCR